LSRKAWVEIDSCSGLAIRVFKNRKLALLAVLEVYGCVKEMERAEAVKQIRQQIFGIQQGRCVDCNKIIYWDTMELHERQHRGEFAKENSEDHLEVEKSGEISLMNSVAVCAECHEREHGDRQVRLGS